MVFWQEKMKSIEANIKYVVLFLIAFLLLLTVFNLIGRCEEKTDVPGMDRADSILVADSIKTSILRSRIDSLENEIEIEPMEAYAQNESYILNITTNVKSLNGKPLKKPIQVQFKID